MIQKNAQIKFYYENGDYVKVSPEKCYSTIFVHQKNGVLAFVTNRSKEEQNVMVKFNLDKLKMQGKKLKATDQLKQKALKIGNDGSLTLPLGSEEWTYIWLSDDENNNNCVKKESITSGSVVNGSFFSKILNKKKKFVVVLPKNYTKDNKDFPVLYLFHGRGRNQHSLTDIPEAAEALKKAEFITVFPDGDDGWYINSPIIKKDRYNDYIEELMNYVENKFRISKKTAERGLSGWSMGGYGCTIFAENHSKSFSAVAPIIGLLDYPSKRKGYPFGC